jgi:tRNA dimethylallyltransferase
MLAREEKVSRSVLDAVGVRELLRNLSGEISLEQAEQTIAARTRRLARRQIRWFDKLAKTLDGRAKITVVRDRRQATLHYMHDIIGS